MMPLKSVFSKVELRLENGGFLRAWKRPVLLRTTKVYAVDYSGRSFAVTSSGETVRNRVTGFLKSA